MTTELRKLKSCGVLLFRRSPAPEFLLMKHPDRFDLPKGHIEEGESERQCALRELEEETGISPENVKLDSDFRFTINYLTTYKRFGGAQVEKTLVVFLGFLETDKEIELSEHEAFEWITWNPPHQIQAQTIDPLLKAAAEFIKT